MRPEGENEKIRRRSFTFNASAPLSTTIFNFPHFFQFPVFCAAPPTNLVAAAREGAVRVSIKISICSLGALAKEKDLFCTARLFVKKILFACRADAFGEVNIYILYNSCEDNAFTRKFKQRGLWCAQRSEKNRVCLWARLIPSDAAAADETTLRAELT